MCVCGGEIDRLTDRLRQIQIDREIQRTSNCLFFLILKLHSH